MLLVVPGAKLDDRTCGCITRAFASKIEVLGRRSDLSRSRSMSQCKANHSRLLLDVEPGAGKPGSVAMSRALDAKFDNVEACAAQ